MYSDKNAIIDGITVPIENERNLLELIRKANIELPTFCYHSEISVYGACRMCMVDVEGRGIVPACSTPVAHGMVVKTSTKRVRDMRRMTIELMLASHDQNCTTCPKSGDCKLQQIARRMGISKVRFQQMSRSGEKDLSSEAIVRDPSKCVLCGDCVRVCSEIQSVGVLDFANRGADARVVTSFDKPLGSVECVNCGQCIKVCPVGALSPKYHIDGVWDAIHNTGKHVVVQIAPAVRVALGEYFGHKAGTLTIGQIVTSLRMMGFDKVYDTSFAADLTVIEEGNEFMNRLQKGDNMPQFTSCCPAWVKFAEQYYPDMLNNLSSCRSPQQMFGSLAKEHLSSELDIAREDLVVVSIMPCTAKKFEANRSEFSTDGNQDVDFVITTTELALMIKESGIEFDRIEPGSFDMPFGFNTGAGIIFGSSGGVSEAVLRYVVSKLQHGAPQEFKQLRDNQGTRIVEVEVAGKQLRLAVVSGLANTRKLIDSIRSGEEHFDLVEVMACCGGCVNGGGQPESAHNSRETISARAQGLYSNDRMLQFHNSSENPYIRELYDGALTEERAHHLLHTTYENRSRITEEDIALSIPEGEKKLTMRICFGTSCFLRGAQNLYSQVMNYLRENDLSDKTEFTASFCGKSCKKGPVLEINGTIIEHCTIEKAIHEINAALL